MNTDAYVHPEAIVEPGVRLGAGTRVWAFAHILPGVVIGDNCNICDHVFIENGVMVGDRVTIKCGVQLWTGTTIADDVFIGPNVTFTNDTFPRSKAYQDAEPVTIEHGASLGANSTVLPNVTVGRRAMVGAGAVVTRDVPPNAIVMGNPARITGYVDAATRPSSLHPTVIADRADGPSEQFLSGATLHRMPAITDLRGTLSFAELGRGLPFPPQRYFLVFDVPSREVRGEHAHKTLHELLICAKGSCSVVLDDGNSRSECVLSHPSMALHIPPMVWATQYKYSADAVLVVLASDPYDADDYIRDYDDYLSAVTGI